MSSQRTFPSFSAVSESPLEPDDEQPGAACAIPDRPSPVLPAGAAFDAKAAYASGMRFFKRRGAEAAEELTQEAVCMAWQEWNGMMQRWGHLGAMTVAKIIRRNQWRALKGLRFATAPGRGHGRRCIMRGKVRIGRRRAGLPLRAPAAALTRLPARGAGWVKAIDHAMDLGQWLAKVPQAVSGIVRLRLLGYRKIEIRKMGLGDYKALTWAREHVPAMLIA
jgi:hypothetical protein